MTELTEREQEKLNTGRMFRAESDMLLPMLQTKTAVVVGKIVAAFKSGGKPYEFLAYAAELSTLSDMKAEISRKITEANHLEEKALGLDKRRSER